MLLRRLVAQVSAGGVYDVGLVSPATLQPFFTSCSFDVDREDSVPMALAAGWDRQEAAMRAGLQARPRLQQLLGAALEGGLACQQPPGAAPVAGGRAGHSKTTGQLH
jgi:hypothetical protein